MSWLRSILDAALESTARMSLRVLGRAEPGDEDRLLPQADRDAVLARCHDLRRNNPIAQGAMVAMEDNVVGGHVTMQARTSDAAWNAKAEEWLKTWSKGADTSGRYTFAGILKECVRSRLFDGELLLVPHASGRLILVESERIRPARGEDLAYGQDDLGRVLWWNVANRDKKTGGFRKDSASRRIRSAIHVTRTTRPDQVRGWPDLATVANVCADIGEINSANLKKYKMGALAAWTLQGGGQLRGRSSRPGTHPLAQFKDGTIYELEPGQTLSSFANNQPGGEYAPFVKLNLQLISLSLRLPYEFLLMYFADSTFASSKVAILQAAKTMNGWRDWLEQQAIMPIMAWAVAEAIRNGELPAAPVDKNGRSEWDKWQWMRPGYDWVDPQSAVQYHVTALRSGLTTYSEALGSYGYDFEETMEARAREAVLLREIARKYGLEVRDLSDLQLNGVPAPAPGGNVGDGPENRKDKTDE
jgi:lambda family phage portal protein